MKNILRYTYAILAVPLIVFLRFALIPLIGPGIPYITLFPVSVVVALLAGFGPAILTGILGSITIDYFFIPPLYAIELTVEGFSRMAIVTLTSAFVGYVGAVLRSARTNAEQQAAALRASEERYHRFFEDGLTGDFIAMPSGQIVVCNPAYVKIFGFSSGEEAMASNLQDLHFLPKEYFDFVKLLKERKVLSRYECLRRRRDGVKIHVVENIVGTFNEHGELTQFKGYVFDDTDRKLAEEELKKAHNDLEQKVVERTAALVQSTDRLRFTMDNMNEGCMIIDTRWTYLYVNEYAARHGHQKRENLIGRTMIEMYPGIEKTEVFANYKRAMNEKIPLRFESAYTFQDGFVNWYEFSVEPVPEGIFVLSIDITERKRLTNTLERNRKELLTFYRLSEIFLSPLSLEEAYNEIVDEICIATGFPIASIGIYDDTNQKIKICGQRSDLGESNRPSFELPVHGTLSGEVIRTGKPLFETHLLDHKKYQLVGPRRSEIQTYVGYPMKIEQKIIGSLNLLHTKNIEINEDLRRWIESLANYLAVLTDRRRSEEELHLSREQLRELSKYTQSAIEEERKRIAREIHDELGQQLSLLQLELGGIESKLHRSEKDLRAKSKSMTKLIDATIQTVQRISTDLRPTLLDDIGLGAAVDWEVRKFQKRTKIKCDVTVEPPEMKLDQDLSIALFRILQETLTNIIRHAGATRVQVQLAEKDKSIMLRVLDNGIGISQLQITDAKSIGLTGIRERVLPWSGSVSITGEPGEKTEIIVTIPSTL